MTSIRREQKYPSRTNLQYALDRLGASGWIGRRLNSEVLYGHGTQEETTKTELELGLRGLQARRGM